MRVWLCAPAPRGWSPQAAGSTPFTCPFQGMSVGARVRASCAWGTWAPRACSPEQGCSWGVRRGGQGGAGGRWGCTRASRETNSLGAEGTGECPPPSYPKPGPGAHPSGGSACPPGGNHYGRRRAKLRARVASHPCPWPQRALGWAHLGPPSPASSVSEVSSLGCPPPPHPPPGSAPPPLPGSPPPPHPGPAPTTRQFGQNHSPPRASVSLPGL